MKFLILGLVFLSFAQASQAGCVDLAGEYASCKSESQASIFKINYVGIHSKKPFSYSFNIITEDGGTSETVIADEVTRQTTEIDPEMGEYTTNVTASCNTKALSIVSKTDLIDMTEKTVYSRPTANTLKIESYIDEDQVNVITCKKINL